MTAIGGQGIGNANYNELGINALKLSQMCVVLMIFTLLGM